MRILQIFNKYQERGGEETAVEEISALLGERQSVETLSFSSGEWRNENLLLKLTQPFRMIWNPSSRKALIQKLKDFEPDLVIVHNVMPVGSFAVYHTLLQYGVPFMNYIHNFRPFSVNGYCWAGGHLAPEGLKLNYWPEVQAGAWRGSRLLTGWYALILRLSHALGLWKKIPAWVAISHFMAEKFIQGGIEPSKIHVLHHFGPILAPLSVVPLSKQPIFLFLGRLSQEKGIEVLVKAWGIYKSGGGTGRLIVAGDGPLSSWLKEQTLKVEGLEAVGRIDGAEKQFHLDSCHALVVPSIWWEPFGLVVLEAYSMGKPVIAFRSGGLSELVLPGITGWLLETGSADALASIFQEIGLNPAGAIQLGLAARAWVEVNGSRERWISGFEAIVLKIRQEASLGAD